MYYIAAEYSGCGEKRAWNERSERAIDHISTYLAVC